MQDNPVHVIARNGALGETVQQAVRSSLMDVPATRQRYERKASSKTQSTSDRQVKAHSSTFLQRMPDQFVTPDDIDHLQSLRDLFVCARKHITCTACQGTGDIGETIVSCCCYAFSCKTCTLQFFVQTPKRCMACNMNWGPFKLSQVLVAPPCAEFTNLTSSMRDDIISRWNEAVESIR